MCLWVLRQKVLGDCVGSLCMGVLMYHSVNALTRDAPLLPTTMVRDSRWYLCGTFFKIASKNAAMRAMCQKSSAHDNHQ